METCTGHEPTKIKIDLEKKGEPRKYFTQAMCELAARDPRVYLLSADMGVTHPDFLKEHPNRFLNFGIAEQNMVGAAAGMALCGKIPFAATMSCFISMRACEQVRTDVCYPCLNVKFFGFGCGTSFGILASTHHSTEDLAILRSIPHMTIVCPASPTEVYKSVFAAAEYPGPVYIRGGRGDEPLIYDGDYTFTIGKAIPLRAGKDVAILATGVAVARALLAARELEKEGIEARVVNVHTLKPLDREAVIEAATGVKGVITVEDHNIYGGLGSAVAEVLAEEHLGPLKRLGIPDVFCTAGSQAQILDKYNVGVDDIRKAARAFCGR
jgi:transketolase